MAVRQANFAGSWYDGNAQSCRATIEKYIADAKDVSAGGVKRVGGVVPHAGWSFSGAIACNVFKCLKTETDPDVVVIFGTHLAPAYPNMIMTDGEWETPLGNIEIDGDFARKLVEGFDFSVQDPASAPPDNTIELQLPFMKYFFPDAKLVPVSPAPTKTATQIGERAADIAQDSGAAVRFIGSTDLTHYGPNYMFVTHGMGAESVEWVKEVNDKRIVDMMTRLDAAPIVQEGLQHDNACCPGAAAAAIAAGKKMGATEAELLVYMTSYDVHPNASFVGYAGIVF
ncbi:MAG: AmmeMemoRadiSam system protein B [Planctomycetes bacterium]|nr:AmmeMemoRadiSam system protein B [Planctomycetota bacterium]